MLNNLNYKLKNIQKEIENQQKEYIWAITWNLDTKPIIHKIIVLEKEKDFLNEIIDKLKNHKNVK